MGLKVGPKGKLLNLIDFKETKCLQEFEVDKETGVLKVVDNTVQENRKTINLHEANQASISNPRLEITTTPEPTPSTSSLQHSVGFCNVIFLIFVLPV